MFILLLTQRGVLEMKKESKHTIEVKFVIVQVEAQKMHIKIFLVIIIKHRIQWKITKNAL